MDEFACGCGWPGKKLRNDPRTLDDNQVSFLSLKTPSGDRGEMLTLWVIQRGPERKWSAGIDDGQTNSLEAKWDHFPSQWHAQHWALMRGVEWLREGIAEFSRELDALDQQREAGEPVEDAGSGPAR